MKFAKIRRSLAQAGGALLLFGGTPACGRDAADGVKERAPDAGPAALDASLPLDASEGDAADGGFAAADAAQSEIDAAPEASTADEDAGAPRTTAPELINPAPGSRLFLGANLWNIDWEGAQDYFMPATDWSTTTNPWNPQFLSDLAPYHALRFMDWNLTNESNNPQADWGTRKKPTADQTTSPVAFEWQIDLCNRTQKDYWVNISHLASADYVTKLAQLIHDKLDPRLRVYVEWSNEVWNGGFPQREYALGQGDKLGLVGDDKGFAFQVYQSVRVFSAFDAVFGPDKARVVKVLAGQAANWGVCELHLDALADPIINPDSVKPDVYAVAPYFSGATLAELTQTGIPEAASWIGDTYRCAKRADLKVIAYEGGQDSYVATGGEQPCADVQNLSGMREIYVSFLDAMLGADLTGPLMQYTHSGYCWGMKQKTSDSTGSSPKYQGMLDWLSEHP